MTDTYKNLPPDTNYRHLDFEYLDMMGLTDKELLELMSPAALQEMKDYLE